MRSFDMRDADVFAGAVGTNELVEILGTRQPRRVSCFLGTVPPATSWSRHFFALQRTNFVTAQSIAGVRVLGVLATITRPTMFTRRRNSARQSSRPILQSLGIAPRGFNSM